MYKYICMQYKSTICLKTIKLANTSDQIKCKCSNEYDDNKILKSYIINEIRKLTLNTTVIH